MKKKNYKITAVTAAITMLISFAPANPFSEFELETSVSATTNNYDEKFLFDDSTGTLCGYIGNETIVEIPSSFDDIKVTAIGSYAFWGNENIEKVIIPEGVVSIKDHGFESCTNLTEISLPDSLTTIEERAFLNCQSIESIILSDFVKIVGDGVFGGCESMKSLSVPCFLNGSDFGLDGDKIKYRHIYKPKTDSAEGSGYECICECGNNSYQFCESQEGITITKCLTDHFNQDIPDELFGLPVVSIADDAFCKQEHLMNLNIPASLTDIGANNFNNDNNKNLKEINVDENNPYFSSENGVLFNKDKTVLLLYPHCSSRDTYTLPHTVKEISGEAFKNAEKLKSITLPANLKKIDETAFTNCNLDNIYYEGAQNEWNYLMDSLENKDIFQNIAVSYNEPYPDRATLALDGSLKVRVSFTNKIKEDDGWTINGNNISTISTTETYTEFDVAAKDFFDDIVIKCGDETKVIFKVSDMIEKYKKSKKTEIKTLAGALEKYCLAAKAYFADEQVTDYSTSWETVKSDIIPYDGQKEEDYVGSTLLLKSKTILRHYYKSNVEGSVPKDSLFYTEQEIFAHRYSSNTGYSVNDYIYKVLSSDSTDENLKNLCVALYYYGKEANNYYSED